jgi:hypothetical protein
VSIINEQYKENALKFISEGVIKDDKQLNIKNYKNLLQIKLV